MRITFGGPLPDLRVWVNPGQNVWRMQLTATDTGDPIDVPGAVAVLARGTASFSTPVVQGLASWSLDEADARTLLGAGLTLKIVHSGGAVTALAHGEGVLA